MRPGAAKAPPMAGGAVELTVEDAQALEFEAAAARARRFGRG